MKYSLRSLMIVAVLFPPLLAGGYFLLRYVMSSERTMTGAAFIALIIFIATLMALVSPSRHRP